MSLKRFSLVRLLSFSGGGSRSRQLQAVKTTSHTTFADAHGMLRGGCRSFLGAFCWLAFDQLYELELIDHGHAQLLSFGKLASRPLTDHQVVGL